MFAAANPIDLDDIMEKRGLSEAARQTLELCLRAGKKEAVASSFKEELHAARSEHAFERFKEQIDAAVSKRNRERALAGVRPRTLGVPLTDTCAPALTRRVLGRARDAVRGPAGGCEPPECRGRHGAPPDGGEPLAHGEAGEGSTQARPPATGRCFASGDPRKLPRSTPRGRCRHRGCCSGDHPRRRPGPHRRDALPDADPVRTH